MNMNDIPDGLGHDPYMWNDSLYFDDDCDIDTSEEYSEDDLLERKEYFYKIEQEKLWLKI